MPPNDEAQCELSPPAILSAYECFFGGRDCQYARYSAAHFGRAWTESLAPKRALIYARSGARVEENLKWSISGATWSRLHCSLRQSSSPAGRAPATGIYARAWDDCLPCRCTPRKLILRGAAAPDLRDYREYTQLAHHFDVPDDVAFGRTAGCCNPSSALFHNRSALTLTDKFPFVFSRGTPQVMDNFEMMRDFRGLSDDAYGHATRLYDHQHQQPAHVDLPMAQGLIDFAQYGQLSIVTPFTLVGAMAPTPLQERSL